MKVFSFYDPLTGLFTGATVSGNAQSLAANLPANRAAIEGRFDRICQRVDVVSGAVVDYQPPQTDADHEWRAENPEAPTRASQRWRWLKRPEILALELAHANARAAIAEQEAASLRAMREALIATLPEGPALQRLREIDREISAARAVFQRPAASPQTSGPAPTASESPLEG